MKKNCASVFSRANVRAISRLDALVHCEFFREQMCELFLRRFRDLTHTFIASVFREQICELFYDFANRCNSILRVRFAGNLRPFSGKAIIGER